MIGSEPKRGRPHDAKGAQAAILNAAETVFAEHGFSGARIDTIAAASGYNKSLIFHYFGDKVGLYTAVLKRSEEQGNEMIEEAFSSLLHDPTVAADPTRLKTLLESALGLMFDFLVSHPQFLRIYSWEQAEGWRTLKTIWSEFDQSEDEQFIAVLAEAQKAGVLRPDIPPHLVFYLAQASCLTYLSSIPILQLMTPQEDLNSQDSLVRLREQIIAFISHGVMPDSPNDTAKNIAAGTE